MPTYCHYIGLFILKMDIAGGVASVEESLFSAESGAPLSTGLC
jgi:hypothetical protein